MTNYYSKISKKAKPADKPLKDFLKRGGTKNAEEVFDKLLKLSAKPKDRP
jgi:hypothetical protein